MDTLGLDSRLEVLARSPDASLIGRVTRLIGRVTRLIGRVTRLIGRVTHLIGRVTSLIRVTMLA
jgi:hypothetical protein